jgi:hypothetical protein
MRDKLRELLHALGLHKRFTSLKTLSGILHVLWKAAPRLVPSVIFLRVFTALIPLGILGVSRRIIDIICWPWNFFSLP